VRRRAQLGQPPEPANRVKKTDVNPATGKVWTDAEWAARRKLQKRGFLKSISPKPVQPPPKPVPPPPKRAYVTIGKFSPFLNRIVENEADLAEHKTLFNRTRNADWKKNNPEKNRASIARYKKSEKGIANIKKSTAQGNLKTSRQNLAAGAAKAEAHPETTMKFDERIIPLMLYKRSKPEPVRAQFPTKQNRKFQVPLLYPPNTYMIDLMENPVEGKGNLTYLIMIDPLTRKLWAEPTNPAVPGGAYRFDN
jgi:hypothetical protein